MTGQCGGAFAKSPKCSGSVACVAEQHALQPAAQVAEAQGFGREDTEPAQRQAEGTRLTPQHWLKGMSDRAELRRAAVAPADAAYRTLAPGSGK